MTITLNGKALPLDTPKDLSALVRDYTKNPAHVIAELNGAIIPADQWPAQFLKEGDVLELVTFVGGG